MSTNEDAPEFGITEEDRRKMGELLESTKRLRRGQFEGHHGYPVPEPVACALAVCPDDFTPARKLVAAFLFANRKATVSEAVEATGVSDPTVKAALDTLAQHGHANTRTRSTATQGRDPTEYLATPPDEWVGE